MPATALRTCLIALLMSCVCGAAFAGQAPTPGPTPGPNQPKPKTVPELLAIIKANNDPDARREAILKLADITEAEERNNNVVEALVDVVVKGTDPFVPRAAVETLTKLQINITKRAKTKYVKPFNDILKNKESMPGTRSSIATCYLKTLSREELQDQDAFHILLEIAGNRSEQNLALRGEAIKACGAFGSAEALPMLATLLTEQDDYIREAGVNALDNLMDKDPAVGASASPAAVTKLVEILTTEIPKGPDGTPDANAISVKIVVIHVLAKMIQAGNQFANKAMDELIKIVANALEDSLVKAGIEALGIIGSDKAQGPLEKAYTDYFPEHFAKVEASTPRDIDMRVAVARAERSLLNVQAQKANPDMATVKRVSALLGKMLDDKVESPVVRRAAIFAVGYLYPKKFETEVKETSYSLIAILANTSDTDLKGIIPDVLEAITRVNYGTKVKPWLDWWQKKYPEPRHP